MLFIFVRAFYDWGTDIDPPNGGREYFEIYGVILFSIFEPSFEILFKDGKVFYFPSNDFLA